MNWCRSPSRIMAFRFFSRAPLLLFQAPLIVTSCSSSTLKAFSAPSAVLPRLRTSCSALVVSVSLAFMTISRSFVSSGQGSLGRIVRVAGLVHQVGRCSPLLLCSIALLALGYHLQPSLMIRLLRLGGRVFLTQRYVNVRSGGWHVSCVTNGQSAKPCPSLSRVVHGLIRRNVRVRGYIFFLIIDSVAVNSASFATKNSSLTASSFSSARFPRPVVFMRGFRPRCTAANGMGLLVCSPSARLGCQWEPWLPQGRLPYAYSILT